METMAFLGCSRGLGRAVCLEFDRQNHLLGSLLVARSKASLNSLAQEMSHQPCSVVMDFSKREAVKPLLDLLAETKMNRLFYFAGGGPHGLYSDKAWKDHLWSLQVSFLTPSEILHGVLSRPDLSHITQLVFVGSLIADSQADPGAASYAAAKHGLKGLIETVQSENPDRDIRFFRPGYMNTDLLPKKARPRAEGRPLLEPAAAAEGFVKWVMTPQAPKILDMGL